MRRKKLPGKNPTCVCGHKKNRHHDEWTQWNDGSKHHFTGCKEEKEEYCHCDKFFDRRHCKISRWDDVLDVFTSVPKYAARCGFGYDEIQEKSGKSMPTISRRVTLFELLGLITKSYGYVAGWRDGWIVKWNEERYLKLVKEGIIVDG